MQMQLHCSSSSSIICRHASERGPKVKAVRCLAYRGHAKAVSATQIGLLQSRRPGQPVVAAAVAAPADAEALPDTEDTSTAEQPEAPPQAESVQEAPAVEEFDIPKLGNLQLQAIINTDGHISPAVEPGTAAAVFAVYDQLQKLQYIGFSKDLRASLKTVLGRRPDKAFYFKSLQLLEVNQENMMAIRQAWFDECGAPPPGNKLALERKAWQSAVDAGAISARAKPAAAAEKMRELLAILKQRGCQEEFVADPELLANGQVDFFSSQGGQQQTEQQPGRGEDDDTRADSAAASSNSSSKDSAKQARTATVVVDGQAKQFMVEYVMKFPTKGGHMVDTKLSFDHMDTMHRIIIGKSYYEPYDIPVELAVEACLALILSKKLPRHNEGMLGTAEFPVNYFTVSEMEQWFNEEFAAQFQHTCGHTLKDGMDSFWRMNKIHDYGAKLEDPASLGAALTGKGLGHMGA